MIKSNLLWIAIIYWIKIINKELLIQKGIFKSQNLLKLWENNSTKMKWNLKSKVQKIKTKINEENIIKN